MNKKTLTIVIIALIALAGIFYYGQNKKTKNSEDNISQNSNQAEDNSLPIDIGNEAPNFTLNNLAGETVSLKDYKGKTVLINFWGTECPFCVKEMPDLNKLYINHKNENFEVLAINVGESEKKVKEFLNDEDYQFTILLDNKADIAVRYMVTGIPMSIMIDEEGIIRVVKVGLMSYDTMEEIFKYVKK